MVESLKRGDEVITSGGIIGTVDRVTGIPTLALWHLKPISGFPKINGSMIECGARSRENVL